MPVLMIIGITLFRLFMAKAPGWLRTKVTRRHLKWTVITMWLSCFCFYCFLSLAWPYITGYHYVDYSRDCYLEYLHSVQMTVFMICFEFAVPLLVLLFLNVWLFNHILLISRKKNQLKKINFCRGNMTIRAKPCRRQVTFPTTHNRVSPESSAALGDVAGKHPKDERTTPTLQMPEIPEISTFKVVSTSRDIPVPLLNPVHLANEPNISPESVTARPLGQGGATGDLEPHFEIFVRHRKAAVMLFTLVAVFVLCWLPFHVICVVKLAYPRSVSLRLMNGISSLLLFNALLNPFLYGATNVSFRTRIRSASSFTEDLATLVVAADLDKNCGLGAVRTAHSTEL